jgi:hypothetical protein
MDEIRIRQLTEEVLMQLREGAGPGSADLEARVAALEAAVRAFQSSPAVAVAVAAPHTHPSLKLFDVASGAGRCVLEPDRPCVQSGQCRSFGH